MSDPQTPQRRRVSSQRSIPSWLVLATIAAVVIAVVGFFVSGSPDQDSQVADDASADASVSTPTQTASSDSASEKDPEQKSEKNNNKNKDKKKDKKKNKDKPVPRAYVEIYNNTKISGLASSTSSQVQGAGWKVVGTDNWYGNIPATTIYYPERLEKQAKLLAQDLGIDRVRPAVDPMKFDRLTLILTGQV